MNAFHFKEITLGATSSLGCIIAFFAGGWISQYFGKRTMLVVSNLCSFIIWIMLALKEVRVEFLIIQRFLMGIFSAAASGCVGRIVFMSSKRWLLLLYSSVLVN